MPKLRIRANKRDFKVTIKLTGNELKNLRAALRAQKHRSNTIEKLVQMLDDATITPAGRDIWDAV